MIFRQKKFAEYKYLLYLCPEFQGETWVISTINHTAQMPTDAGSKWAPKHPRILNQIWNCLIISAQIICISQKKVVSLQANWERKQNTQQNMLLKTFQHIGEYFLLLGKVLRLPDRQRMFWRQYSRELEKQGLQSLPIVIIISVFIGAILTIQAKTNTENPFLPT